MKNHVNELQAARDISRGKNANLTGLSSDIKNLCECSRMRSALPVNGAIVDIEKIIKRIGNPAYQDYAFYLLLEKTYNTLRKSAEGLEEIKRLSARLPEATRYFFSGIYEYNIAHQNLSDDPKESIIRAYRNFEKAHYCGFEFINQHWLYNDDTMKAINYAISFETFDRLTKWNSFSPDDVIEIHRHNEDFEPKNKKAHVIGLDAVYFSKFFDLFYSSLKPYLDEVDLIVLIEGHDVNTKTLEQKYPKTCFYKTHFDFSDKKSMYTVLRFRIALQAFNMKYTEVISSDVDVKIKDCYPAFFEKCNATITLMRAELPKAPWRGNDAKMILFKETGDYDPKAFLTYMLKIIALRYKPNLNPHGNKQWFIDQFCLGLMLDGASFQLPGFEDISYTSVARKDSPVISADMAGMTKEEFFGGLK